MSLHLHGVTRPQWVKLGSDNTKVTFKINRQAANLFGLIQVTRRQLVDSCGAAYSGEIIHVSKIRKLRGWWRHIHVSHNQGYHKSHCHVIKPLLSKNTKYDLIFHWNLIIAHPGTLWYDSRVLCLHRCHVGGPWRHRKKEISALCVCTRKKPPK